jgi:hypothetical protein
MNDHVGGGVRASACLMAHSIQILVAWFSTPKKEQAAA